MLHIYLIDNRLFIDQNLDLKPHQSLQLRITYGFFKDENHNRLISELEISSNLPRLLYYLQEEGIQYELSENCLKTYEAVQTKKEDFEGFVETAKKYKDANFDADDFQNYLDFLKENIPRRLRDHQKKAFYHLSKIKNGANFSVPGSGKTTVVLSSYEKAKAENEVNILFVVGPPACFGPWKKEFKDVLGRVPSTKILAGGNRESRKESYYEFNDLSELYLTTFQTLMQDQREAISFLSNPKVKVFLVIDEAHYIKQIEGSWANAVLSLASSAIRKCVLTGTPIPKSYSDLYNIFDFLWPDNTVVSGEIRGHIERYEKNNDYEKASEILDLAVGPLFYRVRKKELGLKPQIFHNPIKISMNENEKRIYNAIIGKIWQYSSRDEFLKDAISDVAIKLKRGRMMRLRQIFSYAKLLSTAIDDYDETLLDDKDLEKIIYKYDEIEIPGKLEYLLEMVNNFRNKKQKVVIWANFIGTINLIEKSLLKNDLYCKKIYGQTPYGNDSYQEEETREKIRDEFVNKDSGLDILIANPAACSESISLHKTCHNAVYYDLSYNCAQYLQSMDRIHRVGGSEENEAHYYFLQYDDTVEPRILNNLNLKAQKMYQIIEGDYPIYSLDMFDESENLDMDIYNELFITQQ